MPKASLIKRIKKIPFRWAVCWLALAVIIVIVPGIVRMHCREINSEEALVFTFTRDLMWDAFSYYKSFILTVVFWVVFASFAVDIAIGEFKINKQMIKDPVVAASFVYMTFVILSAVFSVYPQTALYGIFERREGVFALLAYVTAMLLARGVTVNAKTGRVLYSFFLLSAFTVGVIGVFQTFGLDLFVTDFADRLVMGQYYHDAIFHITGGKTYMTMHNSNAAGLYASTFAPVFLFGTLYADRKDPFKYLSAIACLILAVCLYGADSVAGYIGFVAAIAVSAVILCLRHWKMTKNKRRFLTVMCAALVVFAVTAAVNFNRITSLLVYHFNLDGEKYPPVITDVELSGETARFIGREGVTAFIVAPKEDPGFRIEGYEPVYEELVDGFMMTYYNIPGVGHIEMRYADDRCFVSVGETYCFLSNRWGEMTMLDIRQRYVVLQTDAPSFGFEGYERLATGRGYIWSRSIPLVRNNILLGGGPDTYVFQFPYNDLLGKLRGLGNPYLVVDKPHNMFLGIAINTGVLSLIAICVVYFFFFKRGLKAIVMPKGGDRLLFGVMLGICVGVFAHLVCSLSTDSLVSVTPLFYAAMGFGFGLFKIFDSESV